MSGAGSAPLANMSAEGAQVGFTIQGVPGVPTFEGLLKEDEIHGTFSQSGQRFAFMLECETGRSAVVVGEGAVMYTFRKIAER